MREKRREQRWRTYMGGRASFLRERPTADVLIRNVSASGAKIVICNNRFIPEHFTLTILKWQSRYRARACWHRDNEMGIEFEKGLSDDLPNLLAP